MFREHNVTFTWIPATERPQNDGLYLVYGTENVWSDGPPPNVGVCRFRYFHRNEVHWWDWDDVQYWADLGALMPNI